MKIKWLYGNTYLCTSAQYDQWQKLTMEVDKFIKLSGENVWVLMDRTYARHIGKAWNKGFKEGFVWGALATGVGCFIGELYILYEESKQKEIKESE